MMNKETTVTFRFHSFANKEGLEIPKVAIITAKGFENIQDAEMWGHHRATHISLEAGEAFYLSSASANPLNFVCCPGPAFYSEGVTHLTEIEML
jgi:hypothetical protein